MSFKVEVIADSSGDWVGNALRFEDAKEAETYAVDLAYRWTAVQWWRIVDTDTGLVVKEQQTRF